MPVERAHFERLKTISQRLPRLAWLALAARTTSRLLPLIDKAWPDLPRDVRSVALTLPSEVATYAAGARRPARIGDLLDPYLTPIDADFAPGCFRSLARLALGAVHNLDRSVRRRKYFVWDVDGVFMLYYVQFPWITGKPHDAMVRLHLLSVSRDFDTAFRVASGTGNATPFDSSVFGELWPFGLPPWIAEPWPGEPAPATSSAS